MFRRYLMEKFAAAFDWEDDSGVSVDGSQSAGWGQISTLRHAGNEKTEGFFHRRESAAM